MDPYTGFLVGMQAAGMVIDYRNYKGQKKLIGMGRELEKASIENSIESVRLESAQASLQEMRQLRQNLGYQIATQAARGTSTAQGSAQSLIQGSVSSFKQDERTRRMNLLSKEAQLRASNVLSGLHTLKSETELGRSFLTRQLETLPVSAIGNYLKPAGSSTKSSYGLNQA